MHTKISKFCYF